jgi:hypothetical protein
MLRQLELEDMDAAARVHRTGSIRLCFAGRSAYAQGRPMVLPGARVQNVRGLGAFDGAGMIGMIGMIGFGSTGWINCMCCQDIKGVAWR